MCDTLQNTTFVLKMDFFFPSIDAKRQQLGELLLLHPRFGVEEGGTITDIFSRDFFKYQNNFKATGLLMLKAEGSFQSLHTYIIFLRAFFFCKSSQPSLIQKFVLKHCLKRYCAPRQHYLLILMVRCQRNKYLILHSNIIYG